MKRIGIIDNLHNIKDFSERLYETATAAEVMAATGGNTGNVAFVHGVQKILGNPVARLEWGENPESIRNRFDQLVVCCANQLGAHADLGDWARHLEQIQLPVTLIGLGAQSTDQQTMPSLPEGTMRFLEITKALRPDGNPNIAVRGNFTERVLDHHGIISVPLGCPSLHTSSDKSLGESILKYQDHTILKKVAVAAGNPFHGRSATLERTLVEIVNHFDGDYILQHPEAMLHFAYGELQNISEKVKERFLAVYGPQWDFDGLLNWYRRNACVFIDAPSWMRYLQRFDTVIGPRYHGVALAIQAGIPGCVVTIDSRTAELCEGTSIKSVSIDSALGMTAQELVSCGRWSKLDAEKFDHDRTRRSGGYVNFLNSNGLEPSAHLKSLAA